MKLKGSIAVFAVAAAFSGSAFAYDDPDECRKLIGSPFGFPTVGSAYDSIVNAPYEGTGAVFISGKTMSCTVPKNKKTFIDVGTKNVDQCGLLTALVNADTKIAAGTLTKFADAEDSLRKAGLKVDSLAAQYKISVEGYNLIRPKIEAARQCAFDISILSQ